jgi:hypothetical protein
MNKIYTYLRYDWNGTDYVLVDSDSYLYDGPMAFCDRAMQNQAKNTYGQSTDAAGQASQNEAQERGSLIPGLEREANNPQGFTPGQTNNMLVAGEQGAGGAASGIVGEGNLEAAQTGNSAGLTSGLDSAMRSKGVMLSQNALGVQNQSAELGQKKQEFAQGELGNVMSGDQQANLRALGLEDQSTATGTAAGQAGWLQNMNQTISAISGAGNAAAGMKKAGMF